MSTETPKPEKIDLSKRSAGAFPDGFFSGETVAFAKNLVLMRGGVPIGHPIRVPVQDARASTPPVDSKGKPVYDEPRLPAPFPPESYDKPLISVQEWLDAIDACATSETK